MADYLGKDMPKLGFGLMRLPTKGDEISPSVDLDAVAKMVDIYLKKGFVYFDTAYPYHGGASEKAVGEVICGQYPRESFKLATKMPAMMIREKSQYDEIFKEQLNRTKAGYFDFYLLHGLNTGSSAVTEKLGGWDFMKHLKEEGLAKHIGFSFHDSPEHLDEILTKHPEAEFVQLQLNYHDWLDEGVRSKECYDVARKHNVPVSIMEPLKGGLLATLPAEAQKVFRALDPNASMASWAMRYCGSLDGLLVCLSGMNSEEQLLDNINTFTDFKPLSDEEYKAVNKAVEIIRAIPRIGCTGCRYCVATCPQNIAIPTLIDLLNQYKQFESTDGIRRRYLQAGERSGIASQCIECRTCEDQCPQHLPITDILKEIVDVFEKNF